MCLILPALVSGLDREGWPYPSMRHPQNPKTPMKWNYLYILTNFDESFSLLKWIKADPRMLNKMFKKLNLNKKCMVTRYKAPLKILWSDLKTYKTLHLTFLIKILAKCLKCLWRVSKYLFIQLINSSHRLMP
jgi:hypothetical protein